MTEEDKVRELAKELLWHNKLGGIERMSNALTEVTRAAAKELKLAVDQTDSWIAKANREQQLRIAAEQQMTIKPENIGNKAYDEGWQTGYKLGLERAAGIADSFAFTHGETCDSIAAAIRKAAERERIERAADAQKEKLT